MTMPVVVAEIGLNHNGSVEIAKTIIALAKNMGADYVKFQKRNIDKSYTTAYLEKKRASKWGSTVRDEKLGLEFGEKEYSEIDAYCKQFGIKWFLSVFDLDSVEFAAHWKPDFIKLPSQMACSKKMTDAVVAQKTGIIVSSGMHPFSDIAETMHRINGAKVPKYLLHTTSIYPCPDDKINLERMKMMMEMYEDKCNIGYSNHSEKVIYVVAAAILGAKMVEFHVTLDRNMDGPDHKSSIGPTGFQRIMEHLRSVEVGYGEKIAMPYTDELSKRANYIIEE